MGKKLEAFLHPLQIVQFILLFIIAYISYLWMGLPLAIIVVMIYIDKDVISRIKYQSDIGIELQTIAAMMAGIIYGPWFGLVFGLLYWTLIAGIFEFISWLISPPVTPAWVPFVPSPDSISNGIIGSIGGLVGTSIPLVATVFIATVIRSLINVVKDNIFGHNPKIAYILNVVVNVIVVIAITPYLEALISLL